MAVTHQKMYDTVASDRQPIGIIARTASRLMSPFKLVRRWIFYLLIHSLDAAYDFFRYLRYSSSLHRSLRDRHTLEPLLFFYYHKVEKAMALPEVKPLFGLDYIGTLLDLLDRWVHTTRDLDAIVFRGACASLAHYREYVGESLSQKKPDLLRRIDKFLADYPRARESLNLGGTMTITEEPQVSTDFERLVHQRHSVRNFAGRHIPDDAIVHAVKLAQQSPSVCNRQCWRVHVFSSKADKAEALRHQNGNSGFGHLADRVLLVTADLRAFLTSGERHQAYIDAGMFAMTLVYALQAQGIASCCLNLSISCLQDMALRRDCKIPVCETPIMMIVIGYPTDSLLVAVSTRRPTEAVLSFRDLDAKGVINP